MNGPEHYREAERLIANATDQFAAGGKSAIADGGRVQDLSFVASFTSTLTAIAQVHATLALAAVHVDTEKNTLWAQTVTS